MRTLTGLASAASSGSSSSPLEITLVALGAGLLFSLIGLLLVTSYRGVAKWWVHSADASLEGIPRISGPLRRFNIRVVSGGDEARSAHFKLNVMPKIVGAGFLLLSGIALVAGLVRLA
jgi:hypothetical protein